MEGNEIVFHTMFDLFEHQYIQAITYGCSYAEFWEDDPRIFWWKEEAYEIDQRARVELADNIAWMHGAYVLEAIATAFSDKKNKHDYPPYPYMIETMSEALAKKRKEAELIKMRENFLAVSRAMDHPLDRELEAMREASSTD